MDGSQIVFFCKGRERELQVQTEPAPSVPESIEGERANGRYKAMMIDQGFCFNAGDWNFPDAPLRLYARNRVYEGVTGMESFAPWMRRAESGITERILADITQEIPPEWYEDDYDALMRLLGQLYRRTSRIPELLLSAKNTTRQPFPNWR